MTSIRIIPRYQTKKKIKKKIKIKILKLKKK